MVLSIATHISQFHAQKIPFRIYHGSTNSTRSTTFSEDNSVDTSNLRNIISIDPQARTCLLESNVPMDDLVTATMPFGLVPTVVPEFPGITVGGAFSGTGGESTSFRYGFFDQSVNWIEMILADGEVVTASPSKLSDLFYGAAGTFGTLGVITLLEIQLMPAKPYVELTYHPVQSFAQGQEKLSDLASHSKEIDFVDGIMYSATSGVICSGKLVDYEEYNNQKIPKLVRFSRRWDQWFYIHVLNIFMSSNSSKTRRRELIPLKEYLFRYDRGAFWTGKFVFQWFGVPFNRFTRFLLDWLMSTRILYHGLHASGLGEGYVIQDLCLPSSTAENFASWLDKEYQVYPLWLCPVTQSNRISMNPHVVSLTDAERTNGESLLNIGVWAPLPVGQDRVMCNRRIEDKLKSLAGMKWLYADTFYTEDEFWKMYNRNWYDQLRQKYGAQGLPSVYQKVKTRIEARCRITVDLHMVSDVIMGRLSVSKAWEAIWSVWPLVGVKAVMSAWRKEDYLKKTH